VRELDRLDHHVVALRVQVAHLELRDPRLVEEPPHDVLAGVVEEHDADVAALRVAVRDGHPPVPQVLRLRQAAPERDVRVRDEARQLARRGDVGALAILDHLRLRRQARHLREAGRRDAADLDAEREVLVRIVSGRGRHLSPP